MNTIQLFNWIARGIAVLLTITIHEYIKARVSTNLGDPKPKMQGRLTLNPFKHFEPIGFVIMLVFYYGWGKPVETTATYYKDRKWGTVLTHTAPIIGLFAFGGITAAIGGIISPAYLQFTMTSGLLSGPNPDLTVPLVLLPLSVLSWTAFYSFAFALFNLIPVYPLDGSKILSVFLNPNQVIKINSLEKILLIVLVLLVVGGIVGSILTPVARMLLRSIGLVL